MVCSSSSSSSSTLGSGVLVARHALVAGLFLLYVVPLTMSIPSKRGTYSGTRPESDDDSAALPHHTSWGVPGGSSAGLGDRPWSSDTLRNQQALAAGWPSYVEADKPSYDAQELADMTRKLLTSLRRRAKEQQTGSELEPSRKKRHCWDVADVCCMWNICDGMKKRRR